MYRTLLIFSVVLSFFCLTATADVFQEVERLTPAEFLTLYKQEGVTVIDARPKAVSEKGAIPGALVLPNLQAFTTWAAWYVDPSDRIVLIAPSAEIVELSDKLKSLHVDTISGYLSDSDVSALELELELPKIIDLTTFRQYLLNDDAQVFDVRNLSEYERGHIEGVGHLFMGTLEQQLDQIDPNKPLVIHCQSGMRAAIAHSVLAANGFREVIIYSGGMNEWLAEEQPVVRSSGPDRDDQ